MTRMRVVTALCVLSFAGLLDPGSAAAQATGGDVEEGLAETGPCAGVAPLVATDFGNGETELSDATRRALDRIAESAKASECPLHVVGYAADRSARSERSDEVAIARTNSVLDHLLRQGIKPELLTHAVGGLSRRFGTASANRRIEVTPRPGAGRLCSANGNAAVAEPVSITDFEPADAAISVEAEDAVDRFANAVRDTGCRIAVTGYSSPDGARRANERLAAERASAVASLLEIKGIAAARIDVLAVGSTTRFGIKEANRRVVISVQ